MNKKGFTLLEMLVVIAIIALLAGIMVPAVNKAQQAAWRARTKDEVFQIAAAWESYLMENRKFPEESITEMNVRACKILAGVIPGNNVVGTNGFLEFTTNQIGVAVGAGWVDGEGYRDRWGSMYKVSMDNGMGNDDGVKYNGMVTYESQPKLVTKSVAVWSDAGTTNNVSDDIRSWKDF